MRQPQRLVNSKSWIPREESSLQKVTRQSLVHELTQSQMANAQVLVPWFLSQMPASYFRQVPESSRLHHLRAVTALHETGSQTTVTLKGKSSEGYDEITFIRPGNYPGMLTEMLDQLPPAGAFLSRVKVFTSLDNSLALNIFGYGREKERPPTAEEAKNIYDYAAKLMAGEIDDPLAPKPGPLFERKSLEEYMQRTTSFFVKNSHPRRFLCHRELYAKVEGTESVECHVEKYLAEGVDTSNRFWISLAMSNVLPHIGLQKTSVYLKKNGFDLLRCHLDLVDSANGKEKVTMLRILAHDLQHASHKRPFVEDKARVKRTTQELSRLKWIDNQDLDLALNKKIPLEKAEIINALAAMVHGPMSKKNRYAYTTTNIQKSIMSDRYLKHAVAIADLFCKRFDPVNRMSDEDFKAQYKALQDKIAGNVEDLTAEELLLKMLSVVQYTYRTNLYMPKRYALSLRLNPKVMESTGDEGRDLPYGVFFVHGRRFNGFHCRFREIARGGLRIVTPQTDEGVAVESSRHYDEVYGLSYAQQLKNKDIPEGGAKGVLLCRIHDLLPRSKEFAKRKCVKSFTDSILDLIVNTPETKEHIVDFWGKPEILYFGPDEQIISDDIDYVVQRAALRGYPNPSTFMSSKAAAGINHKVYGVTSEGVAVYLDVALKNYGIDPKTQPFTVKLTGGPDGDVAGNMIKILHREYGSNCKIVGISDGSGCAEDPQGLDMEELLRLFNEGKAIDNYHLEKLSSAGKLYKVDNEEGIQMRNTMHNRVVADAFVPGGGRPYTINVSNIKDYITPEGKCTSSLIVEGANLFLTKDAREKLFKDYGAQIVKDSSANKCGVICSSYEILSCMLLSEEEFNTNKPQLVADVLEKLKGFARNEAELLFREHKLSGESLPVVSQRISNAMNMVKDAVRDKLEGATFEDLKPYYSIIKDHMPKTLIDMAFDRFEERVPLPYAKNIIASSLASKIIYKEGIEFIESQKHQISDSAFRYMEEEKKVQELKHSVLSNDLSPEARKIVAEILNEGGVRTRLSRGKK